MKIEIDAAIDRKVIAVYNKSLNALLFRRTKDAGYSTLFIRTGVISGGGENSFDNIKCDENLQHLHEGDVITITL